MKSLQRFAGLVPALIAAALFAACANPSGGGDGGGGPSGYTVSVDSALANGAISASPANAAAGAVVTLTVTPASGYRLQAGSLTVTKAAGGGTVPPHQTGAAAFTFTMPACNVTVSAAFEAIPAEVYAITIDDELSNGTITASYASAAEDDGVTLWVTPASGYRLQAGSLTVTKDAGGTVAVTLANPGEYTFTMPGEAVTVSAVFEAIPAGAHTVTIDAGLSHGAVSADPASAAEGETVTLWVTPDGTYRLAAGSLAVSGASGAVTVTAGEGNWTFSMPDEAVTVTAAFELDTYAITVSPAAHGEVDVYGGVTPVLAGALVTITATPDADFQFAVTVTPSAGGDPLPLSGEGNTRAFTMPAYAVTVTPSFTLPDRIVYKHGVVNGEAQLWNWENSDATTSFVEPDVGRGGGAGIKAAPVTGSWYGLAIARSGGKEIDLNTVDALSFWARSDDADLVIAEFGFASGDAHQVIYTGEANTGVAIGTEWTNIIVPLPARVDAKAANAFYLVNGNIIGRTLYLDDIEFIQTTPAEVKTITIPAHAVPIPKAPVSTSAASLIPKMDVVFTFNGGDLSLFDMDFSNWFDVTYTLTGSDANLEGDGVTITPVTPGGGFTLSVSFAGKTSNAITIDISESINLMIEDFEALSGEFNQNTGSGYWCWADNISWSGFTGGEGESYEGAHSGGLMFGDACAGGSFGRQNLTLDLSAYSSITFWAKASVTDNAYNFILKDTSDRSVEFTVSAANTWELKTIPLASFSGLNTAQVTGWGVALKVEPTPKATTIFVDNIMAIE
jgi:hypothetical protein